MLSSHASATAFHWRKQFVEIRHIFNVHLFWLSTAFQIEALAKFIDLGTEFVMAK